MHIYCKFYSFSKNGKTLVLCCEGNAGFYEIGVMSTPLAAGYSVLGWNHPGFGGSTGSPFPEQEKHAVDAVMQFAIHKLGFQPHQIIVKGKFKTKLLIIFDQILNNFLEKHIFRL